jgi:hypothetical protein
MDWQRIRLNDVPWQPLEDHPGISTKFLGENQDTGPWALHVRFEPECGDPPHWHTSDTIYVITAGEMSFGDEGVYGVGDVRWVRAGTFYGPELAGKDGCEFLLISSGGPPGMSYDASTARQVGALAGE